MTSERQLRANKANARRSTGPRSPEGKHRASRNATTHGLSAKDFALTDDDKVELDQIRRAYSDHFRPKNPIEADLVEELAMAKMRQKRTWRVESAEINLEIGRQLEGVAEHFPNADDVDRVALAIDWLADNGRALEYLRRYEGQARRAWHHCLQKLEARQQKPQNEPIPENEHSTGVPDAQIPEQIRPKNNLPVRAAAEDRNRPSRSSLPSGSRRTGQKDAIPLDE